MKKLYFWKWFKTELPFLLINFSFLKMLGSQVTVLDPRTKYFHTSCGVNTQKGGNFRQ